MAEDIEVANITRDYGIGPPYYPSMRTTYMMKTDEPDCTGKRFFIRMANGASKTWLSDEKAAAIIES